MTPERRKYAVREVQQRRPLLSNVAVLPSVTTDNSEHVVTR
jgi:hypothetical protein